MEVLMINGTDYSRFIERKGVGWSRNDLDSEKTTRTKDGRMRRDKVTTKRKLEYTLLNMSSDQLAQLDNALSENTFSATYLDLHGIQTREFYCSAFRATLEEASGTGATWGDASFSMTEV